MNPSAQIAGRRRLLILLFFLLEHPADERIQFLAFAPRSGEHGERGVFAQPLNQCLFVEHLEDCGCARKPIVFASIADCHRARPSGCLADNLMLRGAIPPVPMTIQPAWNSGGSSHATSFCAPHTILLRSTSMKSPVST